MSHPPPNRRRPVAVLLLGAALLVGCAAEDEREPIGPENPASRYCISLGYTSSQPSPGSPSRCNFPDGTGCDERAFYVGECGQARSYCQLHGGTIASTTADMGTWTAQYAVCTTSEGRQCPEDPYYRTGACP